MQTRTHPGLSQLVVCRDARRVTSCSAVMALLLVVLQLAGAVDSKFSKSRTQAPLEPSSRCLLLHLHVPKTGGTSVLSYLANTRPFRKSVCYDRYQPAALLRLEWTQELLHWLHLWPVHAGLRGVGLQKPWRATAEQRLANRHLRAQPTHARALTGVGFSKSMR